MEALRCLSIKREKLKIFTFLYLLYLPLAPCGACGLVTLVRREILYSRGIFSAYSGNFD